MTTEHKPQHAVRVDPLVSEHFRRSEFACKCGCGFAAADAGLLAVLEDLRSTFDAPVTITSGCRCQSHNARVGGARDSQHTKGLAADIAVRGIVPSEVANYLAGHYPDRYGLGRYPNWTHIDVRAGPVRWG